MEIVLALAAVVGISLIAVPRVRRRSRGRVRADAGKQWTTTAAARRRRPGSAGAGSRAGWSGRRTAAAAGGPTATALAIEPYDEWDDDLDWGGETAVAAPPAGPAAPLPESDLDWQLPGSGEAATEPAEEPQWNDWPEADRPANGNGAAPPVDDAPAAAAVVETPDRATRHDDARTDAPGTDEPDEIAAGEAEPPTEADWDWEPVVSRRPEPAATTARLATAPASPAGGRARGRKVNPLVLVALYAAFGIGVIVIAVSVISGAMSGPETDRTPRTSATVEPTPSPTPPAASGTANAEAKRLQQAFFDQRGAVIAQENSAVRDARAATRRARDARRRAPAARRRAAARAPARQAPPTPPPATPTTPVTPAAPSGGGGGGGGGGSGCEFCIG